MTGKSKWDKIGKKLHKDVAVKQQEEKQYMDEVKNELATVQGDPELMKMYQDSASVGADNLSGERPILKIYTANKTKNAVLEDGKRPNDGWFFHTLKHAQYEQPIAHIFTISRGYRAEGMVDAKTGKKGEPKFNQLMAGAIIDKGELVPFIMYFTGLKLQNLWDFGKEASLYTKGKLGIPVPMFAMQVKLSTEQVESNFGPVWVVKFDIVKNEANMPVMVADAGLFNILRRGVARAEDTIASIIEAKSTEEVVEGAEVENEPKKLQGASEEAKNPDDIPF